MRLTLEPERASKIRLWILIPTRELNCLAPHHVTLLGTLRQHGIWYSLRTLPGDSLVTRSRNNLADIFLNESSDDENDMSLWLDDDIIFSPESVLQLLACNKDFIAAPYTKKGLHMDRLAAAARKGWKSSDIANAAGTPNVNFLLNQVRLNEPVPVLEAGSGFWLVKRKVFRMMADELPNIRYKRLAEEKAHYGREYAHDFFRVGVWPETGEYVSEDWWFCSPPGQMVYGYGDTTKPIEQYETHSRVVSHSGQSRQVKSPMRRYYRGDLIKVSPKYGWSFSLTLGHRVWVLRDAKKKFVPVEELSLTDRLVVPTPESYIVGHSFVDIQPRNEFVERKFEKGIEYFRYTRTHKDSHWFPVRIRMDDDVMSLLGYWAAEGSRDGN